MMNRLISNKYETRRQGHTCNFCSNRDYDIVISFKKNANITLEADICKKCYISLRRHLDGWYKIKDTNTRTLYIKSVTLDELMEKWGIRAPIRGMFEGPIYVQCDKGGKVNNWPTASVYGYKELIIRDRVVII